jgi:hypothetical protein
MLHLLVGSHHLFQRQADCNHRPQVARLQPLEKALEVFSVPARVLLLRGTIVEPLTAAARGAARLRRRPASGIDRRVVLERVSGAVQSQDQLEGSWSAHCERSRWPRLNVRNSEAWTRPHPHIPNSRSAGGAVRYSSLTAGKRELTRGISDMFGICTARSSQAFQLCSWHVGSHVAPVRRWVL